MKEINVFAVTTVYHVISEPGDMTRYDYLVVRDHDEYRFIPWRSTFAFPDKLNYYEVMDIEDWRGAAHFLEIAAPRYKNVNPHTIVECVNTIKKLRNDRTRD